MLSLILAPAPILTFLPMLTLGPSTAVESTDADSWMNTSPMIFGVFLSLLS